MPTPFEKQMTRERNDMKRRAEYYQAERDKWIRFFNRIEASISHHKRDKPDLMVDEVDERLYVARDKILKDAAEG